MLAFVETIPIEPKTKKIIEQLTGAAGRSANREEALGGSSGDEFIRNNEISLRGANESVRWLRACAAGRFGAQQQCPALLDEGVNWPGLNGPNPRQNRRYVETPRRVSTYTFDLHL